MLKKILCLLITTMMLFSLSSCFISFLIAANDDRADKDEIFDFVQENEEKLLKAINERDFSEFENHGFIHDIDADSSVVDFSCGGAGMGPETAYVGFFYTLHNDMVAVWCAPQSSDMLTPCDSGYEWHEHNGDNRYYTEHICGSFYYYEASF